jgi:hypothetical protein
MTYGYIALISIQLDEHHQVIIACTHDQMSDGSPLPSSRSSCRSHLYSLATYLRVDLVVLIARRH